jgi:hypothetical protein
MARRSPRDTKDRLKRSFAALGLVCVLLFGAGALIQIDSVSPGRLDLQATNRIRQTCGSNASCIVTLHDLIPGAWDTFYEFSPVVPQAEVNTVLKQKIVRTARLQRVLVLLQDGRVQRRQYAHTGQAGPLAGEVVFAATNPHQGWVVYTPDTRFQVTPCDTHEGGSAFGRHGGTYFLLTPQLPGSTGTEPCPTFGARTT